MLRRTVCRGVQYRATSQHNLAIVRRITSPEKLYPNDAQRQAALVLDRRIHFETIDKFRLKMIKFYATLAAQYFGFYVLFTSCLTGVLTYALRQIEFEDAVETFYCVFRDYIDPRAIRSWRRWGEKKGIPNVAAALGFQFQVQQLIIPLVGLLHAGMWRLRARLRWRAGHRGIFRFTSPETDM
eukprot:PhM_4_TR11486/c0_g1_i1/m.42251